MFRPTSPGGVPARFPAAFCEFVRPAVAAAAMRVRRWDGIVEQKPPGEEDQTARLKRLGERLREIDKREAGERKVAQSSQKDASGLAKGLRMSAEFVAGVGVGVVLGWAFDKYLGTSPWGLILFMLLGFGAGMMNVMRASGALGPVSKDQAAQGGEDNK